MMGLIEIGHVIEVQRFYGPRTERLPWFLEEQQSASCGRCSSVDNIGMVAEKVSAQA